MTAWPTAATTSSTPRSTCSAGSASTKLTHRSVDAAAGLPAGSTSNYFRTREALLDAVVERFSARERAIWEGLAIEAYPTTPAALAEVMAMAARVATGPQRTLSLARYAILVEAGVQPSVRAQLSATGAQVNREFLRWMRLAGSTDPARDAPIVMNHWTGLVLHEASPSPTRRSTLPRRSPCSSRPSFNRLEPR